MMLVKMVSAISGSRTGDDGTQVDWPRVGETIDLPDEEAAGLLKTGNVCPAAERVEKATTTENTRRAVVK